MCNRYDATITKLIIIIDYHLYGGFFDGINATFWLRLFTEVIYSCCLVPYSRKPFTQFSPHALRGIINKKTGEYFKIRMLK
jgi:hypothetical protein